MKQQDQHRLLIQKALKGNESAFRTLYDAYKQQLFLVCVRYAKNRTIAQDYLQEAFINIYRNLKQFDEEKGTLFTWMKRITINVCLGDLRKGTLYYVSIAEAYEVKTETEDALSKLSLKEMLALIQTLPPGYRTVFNLYVIDGFTHKEIAEQLDISVGTSKSQLLKARQHLKKKILTNRNTPQRHQYG